MSRRAKDGALLDQLVRQADRVCKAAEQIARRKGPGRPPDYPDHLLATMIVVGVLLRKKTKSAILGWWQAHEAMLAQWLPGQQLPGRSTFYERYRRIWTLYRPAMRILSEHAVRRGWADAHCLATDKSLVRGRGRRWTSRERKRGVCKRGVDRDTSWGYSKHDGWVQGYSYEAVTTAPKNGIIWPLIGSVDTASRNEQSSFLEKTADLPAETRFILGDSGYDSNAVAEAVEWTAGGQRTGRRFLVPQIRRPNVGKPRHGRPESRRRQFHRRRRDQRRREFERPSARRLYTRRKTSVEPFHAQFKHLFELEDRVWHRGLDNNRTQIMAAFVAHQILLTYNHQHRRPHARLQYILDRL